LIVWTHRLLGEWIKFKDLWLLVIDEEHKFWVKDKEKIKAFQWKIDILSMSATPIPRSLNMALSGTKDVSILSHPPSNRKWVETFVCHFEDQIIIEASNNEFQRGGQIFFIHNRVKTIDMFWEYLEELFPDKKIVITHGQLHWHELENRILAFKRKEYDILLSSTVIENGIDFQNVNTIFINDAYKFWISQIHQLRGRVGRKDKKWYCYLLFKRDKLKEDAAKRLSTIVEYSHLWAGFELAVKDLEMRWWGDILGIRQSWQTTEIWITLYLKMLEEKIEELKQNPKITSSTWENKSSQSFVKKIDTNIDLNIWAFLSENYFSSELDKINFYREIESIRDKEELENLIEDFTSINGDLKKENKNLFYLLKVRILANNYSIVSIKRSGVSYEILFSDSITVEELKKFLVLDTKTVFIVSDLKKLKTPCNSFKNDEDFLYFLIDLFEQKKLKKHHINIKK
jgi:transcription-repair coupling factor (superfamily II helicase)